MREGLREKDKVFPRLTGNERPDGGYCPVGSGVGRKAGQGFPLSVELADQGIFGNNSQNTQPGFQCILGVIIDVVNAVQHQPQQSQSSLLMHFRRTINILNFM